MPFRKCMVRFVLEVALHGAILAGLIITRPILGRLLSPPQLESLITPGPPPPASVSGLPQCLLSVKHSPLPGPWSLGGPNSSNLQGTMSMCTVIAGSFVYALISASIFTPRHEKKHVQAILGTIINGGSKVVHEYAGRSRRTAAYSVKTLRVRLETIPRYLGLPACLGVSNHLFSSMNNQLKMVIACLLSFGLGVVLAGVFYTSDSISTYADDISLTVFYLTDSAEALFTLIIKSNTVLSTMLFSLGLRFLVLSLVSSFSSSCSQNREAMKPGMNVARLINNGERQDGAILAEDKSPAEFNKDTLCDDEILPLKVGNAVKDTSERNDSSQVQEAVSILIPSHDKEGGLKRRCTAAISNLSSTKEDPKHANDHSTSLQQQKVDRLDSLTWSQYKSSLSATSPEFVPRFLSPAVVCDTVQDSVPVHWALAPPVSVRITAPVNRHRIKRGARVEGNGGV